MLCRGGALDGAGGAAVGGGADGASDAEVAAHLRALARALRAARADDPVARALALLAEATGPLRAADAATARERLGGVARALGLPPASGAQPTRGRAGPTGAEGGPQALLRAARRAWDDVAPAGLRAPGDAARGAGPGAGLPGGPAGEHARLGAAELAALGELERALAGGDADAAGGAPGWRGWAAALRALDDLAGAARHLPFAPALARLLDPLRAEAVAGAAARGVVVLPGPRGGGLDGGGAGVARAAWGAGPIQTRADWGAPAGAVLGVERHGVVLPDGRSEPALVRVAAGPAPDWLDAARDAYAVVVALGGRHPEGAGAALALRGWLDDLPGADDEARTTTLRYVASCLFLACEAAPGAEVAPGGDVARGALERLLRALEVRGTRLLPVAPEALGDARRYELVLRPGVGAPRVLRPGFEGPGGAVQQRARVLVDPGWLGTMSV